MTNGCDHDHASEDTSKPKAAAKTAPKAATTPKPQQAAAKDRKADK